MSCNGSVWFRHYDVKIWFIMRKRDVFLELFLSDIGEVETR